MTENQRPTLAERIATAGITMTSKQVPAPVNGTEWDRTASHWTVTLTNPVTGETLTTEYHMGVLLTGEPDAAEVLDALVSDATGYDNADGFEDWAREYGYDPDSRAAEADYRSEGKRAETLRAFLGEDFRAFAYETERA